VLRSELPRFKYNPHGDEYSAGLTTIYLSESLFQTRYPPTRSLEIVIKMSGERRVGAGARDIACVKYMTAQANQDIGEALYFFARGNV
jgi:hypothetical protein